MEIKEKITTGLTTLSIIGSGVAAAAAVNSHKLAAAVRPLFDSYTGGWVVRCFYVDSVRECKNRAHWGDKLDNYDLQTTASIAAATLLLLAAVTGACLLYRSYKQHNQTLPMYSR